MNAGFQTARKGLGPAVVTTLPGRTVAANSEHRQARVVPLPTKPRVRCVGMRVVFINRFYYPDISATSQILFDLTRRLASEGVEVSVICSGQLYDNAKAKLPDNEVIEGVRVFRVSTTRFGRGNLFGRACDYASFYPAAAFRLLEVLRAGDVVVAKTDPPLISIVAGAVAKWRGAKLVNWLQDVFPEVATVLGEGGVPRWLDAYLARLRDRSLKLAHVNVAIGNRMKEYLIGRGIKADCVEVIENWADADCVTPKLCSASALRTQLGMQGKFVVGYSGNLGRAHEFETLLQAAMFLRNESSVAFLMIGGGAGMAQLKQRAAELKLRNFVFLPYQPRESLGDSLAAADVHLACLQPALEGFIVPSKLYGILAAGRPTIFIGDQNGEVARILRRERCGRVVEIGDADGLTSEIWRMKLDGTYRQRAGERARAALIERYTAERGAQKWLDVLEQVQQEKAPHTSQVLSPRGA